MCYGKNLGVYHSSNSIGIVVRNFVSFVVKDREEFHSLLYRGAGIFVIPTAAVRAFHKLDRTCLIEIVERAKARHSKFVASKPKEARETRRRNFCYSDPRFTRYLIIIFKKLLKACVSCVFARATIIILISSVSHSRLCSQSERARERSVHEYNPKMLQGLLKYKFVLHASFAGS